MGSRLGVWPLVPSFRRLGRAGRLHVFVRPFCSSSRNHRGAAVRDGQELVEVEVCFRWCSLVSLIALVPLTALPPSRSASFRPLWQARPWPSPSIRRLLVVYLPPDLVFLTHCLPVAYGHSSALSARPHSVTCHGPLRVCMRSLTVSVHT